MNSDLIYPIRMIFSSDSESGALNGLEARAFLIAPYQRGYKWSADPEGAVSKLLDDLFGAFKAGFKEYYLQYITTKILRQKDETLLEVIDGQQRLTTLTLLFSVFSLICKNEELNFTKNKLRYQVRENVSIFFNKFIHNDINILFHTNWVQFIKDFPQNDEQDIYYLFHAVKAINEFSKKNEKDLFDFACFVADNVKIILNNVSGFVSSEKIFKNLNSNKVELTDVELVKGLFLTKAAREKTFNRIKTYQQISDDRAILGRQWDDLVGWANSIEIKSIFFSRDKNPIRAFLYFLATSYGLNYEANRNDRYMLFNFFLDQVNTGKSSAAAFFSELNSFQIILDNWHRDDEIFNFLGFLVYCKGSNFRLEEIYPILRLTIPEVKNHLKQRALSMLPNDVETLDYNEHDHSLHAVLLALSVFFSSSRFNFTKFAHEKWSLEHIFPQNPDHLPDLMYDRDVALLRSLMDIPLEQEEMLVKRYGDFDLEIYKNLVKKISTLPAKLLENEKQLLYKFISSGSLNGIGNMALLSSPDNSSNSNGMFFAKRHNLIKRISKGSFVPKHTYDVFSKLLSDKMDKDTSIWTKQDMHAHRNWAQDKIKELHKTLVDTK